MAGSGTSRAARTAKTAGSAAKAVASAQDHPAPSTQHMGFFLVPDFSMMALSSVTEPLRAANRVSGHPLYSWHLISVDGEPVSSSSGFALTPEFSVDSSPDLSHVFVVASIGVSDYRNPHAFEFLRRHASKGSTLGGISLGTMILARAGLLDRRRCTIHWEALKELAEEFPSIDISRDLYCIEDDRMTCSGGTAAIDMMLDLIARQHGRQLATEVADQFIHTRMRTAQESQTMAIQWRYGVEDRRIVHAITLMEQNIERPIPMKTIASLSGISPRTFERMWLKHFNVRPSQFYLELRLKAAQKLIRESSFSLFEVAMHCGFASASHLGRCYKQFFGKTPGQERAANEARQDAHLHGA